MKKEIGLRESGTLCPPPTPTAFTSNTYIYGHSTLTKVGGIHALIYMGGSVNILPRLYTHI